jgi:hypothetical protein
MVHVLLTLHHPEHFINPYVICNIGYGILFFVNGLLFHIHNCLYTVRSACKLRARRTEYKSVFFSYDINCWRKFGAYLA